MNFYVLAGGESRRMGRNKALLRLQGETLIERSLSSIPDGYPAKIVTNSPEEYDFLQYQTIADVHKDLGPIGGVHAGLADAASFFSFFLACDLPFLSQELVKNLLNRHSKQDIFGGRTRDGYQPLCTIYSANCLAVIESQIKKQDFRLHRLPEMLNSEFIEIGEPGDFFNVNTERDWLFAKSRA
ncbi:molybdenum cofactor guanylyltransferase [bacterium]|nr:molybdenum cofactor guanylyltransferase [bacterium]